jgi:hypothetical protein
MHNKSAGLKDGPHVDDAGDELAGTGTERGLEFAGIGTERGLDRKDDGAIMNGVIAFGGKNIDEEETGQKPSSPPVSIRQTPAASLTSRLIWLLSVSMWLTKFVPIQSFE